MDSTDFPTKSLNRDCTRLVSPYSSPVTIASTSFRSKSVSHCSISNSLLCPGFALHPTHFLTVPITNRPIKAAHGAIIGFVSCVFSPRVRVDTGITDSGGEQSDCDCEYEPWNNAPLSAVTMVAHSSTSEAGRKGWVGAAGLHFDDGAVYSVFSVFALNIVEYDEPPPLPSPHILTAVL